MIYTLLTIRPATINISISVTISLSCFRGQRIVTLRIKGFTFFELGNTIFGN